MTQKNDIAAIAAEAKVKLDIQRISESQFLEGNYVRTLTRSLNDITVNRIRTGNRLAASYMVRTGKVRPVSEENDDGRRVMMAGLPEALESIQSELFKMVTHPLNSDGEPIKEHWVIPKVRAFTPGKFIGNYGELVLADLYAQQLRNEQVAEKNLQVILASHPLYENYLQHIPGIGPRTASAIISELNPFRAKTPSAYISYCGLDTVTVGIYTDKAGKKITIPAWRIDEMVEEAGTDQLEVNGCPVVLVNQGRCKNKAHLKPVTMTNSDGETVSMLSLGYNLRLKTKLVGVLGESFLMQTVMLMDGEKSTKKTRLARATAMGFVHTGTPTTEDKAVNEFLIKSGVSVVKRPGRFGQMYMDHKERLMQRNENVEEKLQPVVIHRRCIRYMIQRFLHELWEISRILYNLPLRCSYEQEKLGLTHSRNEWMWDMYRIDTRAFSATPAHYTIGTVFDPNKSLYIAAAVDNPDHFSVEEDDDDTLVDA